ncbi:Integrase catalytic core protein, partial [Globisporangium splendens]
MVSRWAGPTTTIQLQTSTPMKRRARADLRAVNMAMVRPLNDAPFQQPAGLSMDDRELLTRDGHICVPDATGYLIKWLFINAHPKNVDFVITALEKEYKLKDLGEVKHLLAMEIHHDGDIMTISQQAYVDKVLRQFGVQDSASSRVPMNEKCNPRRPELPYGSDVNRKDIPYRQLVGSLQYLVKCTRPDIANTVPTCSSTSKRLPTADCADHANDFETPIPCQLVEPPADESDPTAKHSIRTNCTPNALSTAATHMWANPSTLLAPTRTSDNMQLAASCPSSERLQLRKTCCD